MSTDDGDDSTAGGASASAAGGAQSAGAQSAGTQSDGARATGDPLREILLALAGQIDQVASWFATDPKHAESAVDGVGGVAGLGQMLSGVFLRDGLGDEVAGEITSLLRECGELLARLIAALIAVLEAVANALRATPQTAGPQPRHYQPIAVRLDMPADAPQTSRVRRPASQPEGQK